MGFFIPAAAAEAATALPPGTGRYRVTITEIRDMGKTDRNGCQRFRLFFRFENGGMGWVFFGSPYDEDGNLSSQLQSMDEQTRDKKVKGYVSAIKEICYSAGFDDDYMNTNGIPSEHLEGRDAFVEWLGRPENVPEGYNAYGDIKAWLSPQVFEKREAAGAPVEDNRTFAWDNAGSGATTTNASGNAGGGGGRKLPAPPSGGGRKLPKPPTR